MKLMLTGASIALGSLGLGVFVGFVGGFMSAAMILTEDDVRKYNRKTRRLPPR